MSARVAIWNSRPRSVESNPAVTANGPTSRTSMLSFSSLLMPDSPASRRGCTGRLLASTVAQPAASTISVWHWDSPRTPETRTLSPMAGTNELSTGV